MSSFSIITFRRRKDRTATATVFVRCVQLSLSSLKIDAPTLQPTSHTMCLRCVFWLFFSLLHNRCGRVRYVWSLLGRLIMAVKRRQELAGDNNSKGNRIPHVSIDDDDEERVNTGRLKVKIGSFIAEILLFSTLSLACESIIARGRWHWTIMSCHCRR